VQVFPCKCPHTPKLLFLHFSLSYLFCCPRKAFVRLTESHQINGEKKKTKKEEDGF
jgi:hypothetical protein